MDGIAMTAPNPVRNIVTKRWLKPANPSIPEKKLFPKWKTETPRIEL